MQKHKIYTFNAHFHSRFNLGGGFYFMNQKNNFESNDICLISPSEVLADTARKMFMDNYESYGIYTAVLDRAVILAKELIDKGTKIIISRKGTAELIKHKLDVPVVSIDTTLNDFLPILEQAKKYSGKIAFVEFNLLLPSLKTLCEISNIDAILFGYGESYEEYESCVWRAIKSGAELVIGGGVLLPKLTEENNIPFIMVENSTRSLEIAFENAKQLLHIKIQEQEKQDHFKFEMEKFKAVINSTHDSIIAMDELGNIIAFNPKADNLLDIKEQTNIKKLLPWYPFDKIVKSKEAKVNQILKFKDMLLTVNSTPLYVNGISKGVVATLHNVEEIQESEQKIRLNLYKKGHIAKHNFDDIISESPNMKDIVSIGKTYASTPYPILIYGETGTGKELLAQSIHNYSDRNKGPFVAINCATLSNNLLESELFGYEAGAFTGALRGGKAGLFEIAHGGTIFLDEIGEIPAETQVQLLRVLQEKEVRRIGGESLIPIDVRVICATNRNLLEEVSKNRFRRDLFYRISTLKIKLPPLRNRGKDIYLISESLLNSYIKNGNEKMLKKLRGFLNRLDGYQWPGNIRELANVVQRLVALSECMELNSITDDLLVETDYLHWCKEVSESSSNPEEYAVIKKALINNSYNRNNTAKELNMSRSTLWRKIKEYGIN